jgi:hypothetical protein
MSRFVFFLNRDQDRFDSLTARSTISGAKSENWSCDLSPEKEPSVLRDLREIELQFREAFPVAGQEARWVSLQLVLVGYLELFNNVSLRSF